MSNVSDSRSPTRLARREETTANRDSQCWDVQSPASLTHGAGGDAGGIVNMVKYTLDKYSGDASKVFVMGGSSGAMMTNVLAGSYLRRLRGRRGLLWNSLRVLRRRAERHPHVAESNMRPGTDQPHPAAVGRVRQERVSRLTGKRLRMQIFHGFGRRARPPRLRNHRSGPVGRLFWVLSWRRTSPASRPRRTPSTSTAMVPSWLASWARELVTSRP